MVSLGSPGKYSMIYCFVRDALLFCPISFGDDLLSAADTHFKLLDRVVSGASFLTGSVFQCDLAHHRSVAVLWMLYEIRCNPLHPFYGDLPLPYVPVLVPRNTVISHRYAYVPPRSRTSQYYGTFIYLSVSL